MCFVRIGLVHGSFISRQVERQHLINTCVTCYLVTVDFEDLRSEAKRKGFNRLPQVTDMSSSKQDKPKNSKGMKLKEGKETTGIRSKRGRQIKPSAKPPNQPEVPPPRPKKVKAMYCSMLSDSFLPLAIKLHF